MMDYRRSKRQNAVFYSLILLNIIARGLAAFYMIISDCDETFNYWEPLNLVLRGFGKETWEYSPEYAIRSYFYLMPYALLSIPMKIARLFVEFPDYYYFYWIRIVGLCGFTSISEVFLASKAATYVNVDLANWFLLLSSISTGMSHAGVALLPSSFAMDCVSIATGYAFAAISENNVSDFAISLLWFFVGGVVGWPFVLALGVPFGLYMIAVNIRLFERLAKITSMFVVRALAVAVVIALVDYCFYKRTIFVPLNIVLYNVFGDEGEGPEIFGVEPLKYYVLNLAVNFNVVAFLGYLGSVLNPIFWDNRNVALVGITLPLLLWSFIFGSQAHKEERFLYPIYPFLLLSCSLFLVMLFSLSRWTLNKIFRNRRASKLLNRFAIAIFILSTSVVSVLRTVNLVENYSSPLSVAKALAGNDTDSHVPINVCIGREWYHFPTSFFLPKDYRLRFVKSGFDGLLPGDFRELPGFSGLFESARDIPYDMNNKNQFSVSKLTDFLECSYYIDNNQTTDKTSGEPDIFYDPVESQNWSTVKCEKLINPDGHSGLGRLLYIPQFARQFIPYDVEYMEFCLLKRK